MCRGVWIDEDVENQPTAPRSRPQKAPSAQQPRVTAKPQGKLAPAGDFAQPAPVGYSAQL